MKCPIDQTEMEEGYLRGYQMATIWVKKGTGFFKLISGVNSRKLTAWNCVRCGKVEFKTQVEGNKN